MSLVNRNELRRLEKAAREKDKQKLVEWLEQFEAQLMSIFNTDFEKSYKDQVQNSIDNLMIAVAYTLHFSDETHLGSKKLPNFMEDLFVTLDMFRTGEYTPEEYEEELKKCGVQLTTYDYNRIYKKFLNIYDTDLVEYLRSNHRKIITICGNSKYKDDILNAKKELECAGNMVFTKTILETQDVNNLIYEEFDYDQLNQIHKEKILISDAIYVVNKDNDIDKQTQLEIDYAKSHNKEIRYMEKITE